MREDWMEIDYKEVVNKVSTNNKKLKQKEYLQKGAYPVIDQGQELIGGYTDDETRLLDCALPAIVFGDHTKIVKLINFKFAPGADGTKVLEPKKFVLPKYLSYLTQILVFKIKDKGYARHYQHIEKQSFPIAPLPEQRAIVAKIEQLFSELDNGIANLKAAKDKLEIYRQAVLKKAFEGDFTTEYRLRKTGRSDKSKWESDNLKNRTTQITKGSTPTTYGFKYLDDGINFIKVENITNGKVDLNSITQFIGLDAHEFQKRSQLAVNDILFSIAGTIGETVILKKEHLPANTNQALAIIRGFEESLLPDYLLYLLRSFVALTVKSKARGGAMNNVSLGDLKKLEILIPPKDEQTVILSEIESRLSVCDNILANIEEGLEKSEALRQSILKQAFEGKLLSEEELEACRKEPDWEPAEKLLARIKNTKKELTEA